MEKGHASKSNPMIDNCPDPFLFNFEVLDLANAKHVPRLGDIWIPRSLEID
jgi:hypothetical protein